MNSSSPVDAFEPALNPAPGPSAAGRVDGFVSQHCPGTRAAQRRSKLDSYALMVGAQCRARTLDRAAVIPWLDDCRSVLVGGEEFLVADPLHFDPVHRSGAVPVLVGPGRGPAGRGGRPRTLAGLGQAATVEAATQCLAYRLRGLGCAEPAGLQPSVEPRWAGDPQLAERQSCRAAGPTAAEAL